TLRISRVSTLFPYTTLFRSRVFPQFPRIWRIWEKKRTPDRKIYLLLKHMFQNPLTTSSSSSTIRIENGGRAVKIMPPREFTSMTKYRKNRPDGPDFSAHESARVKKVLRTGAAVILVILACCAVWFLAHNFTELYTIFISDDPAAAMDAFLDGNRFLGVLIVFCIQVVQVLLAFI